YIGRHARPVSRNRGEDMPDERETPAAEAKGTQGMQVGTGNVQYNNWAPPAPLDSAALRALNPYAAAERLREMPYDNVVDVFASASPGDVDEVLKVLLKVDEALVVAVLADLSPRRAAELISPLHEVVPWLVSLPEAAGEIARLALELGWG